MIKRTKNESLSLARNTIKKFDTAEVLLSLVDEGKISAEELLLECVKHMDDDSRKSIISKVNKTLNESRRLSYRIAELERRVSNMK